MKSLEGVSTKAKKSNPEQQGVHQSGGITQTIYFGSTNKQSKKEKKEKKKKKQEKLERKINESPQVAELRKKVEELTKQMEDLKSLDKPKTAESAVPKSPEQSKTDTPESSKQQEVPAVAPPPALPPPPAARNEQPTATPEKPKTRKEYTGFDIDPELRENDKVVLRNTLRNRGHLEMQKFQKVLRDRQEIRNKSEAEMKKIEDSVKNGEIDPVKLEYAKALQANFKKIEDLQEKAMPHAKKMYDAERTYLTALREFHSKRGFFSVALNKFTKSQPNLPDDVKEFKKAWVASRAEYAGYLKASAAERLREKGKSEDYISKALEKYERGTVLREVVFGAEEAERRARINGLESREKGFIEQRIDWFNNKLSKPQKVLIGAALMGGLGTAAVAGGSVVGLLGTIMAVPSALYAVRALLEKDQAKKEKYVNKAAGFAKWTIGGIFGRLAETGTRKGHEVFKTKEKAEKGLTLTNKKGYREGLGDLTDASNIGSLSERRNRLLRTEENIEVDARWARGLGAFAGGAAFGAGASALMHEGAVAAIPGDIHSVETHLGIEHGPAAAVPSPEHINPPSQDHLSIGEHVGGVNIYDADRLLGHFAEKVHANHLSLAGHEPPAVKTLYSLLEKKGHTGFTSNEDSAAIHLGLETRDGSAIMQPGDTMSFHNGELVLDRGGAHPLHWVLIDTKGNPNPLTPKDWPHSVEHIQPPHAAATHPTETQPQAQTVEQPAAVPPAPHEVASTNSGPAETSANHGDVLLNNQNHETDLKLILADQKLRNDYSTLIDEHTKAVDAYSRGLHTEADVTAYQTYVNHYNQYTGEHFKYEIIATQPAVIETSSSPITAPTHSTIETVAPHVQSLEALHASVVDLKNTPGWDAIREANAVQVYSIAPQPSELGQIVFRNKFLEVVKEAGVQPAVGQSVSEYIDQINK